MTLAEIKRMLPRSFVSQDSVDLFEEMMEMLNRQAGKA